jgi:hypothetical protein
VRFFALLVFGCAAVTPLAHEAEEQDLGVASAIVAVDAGEDLAEVADLARHPDLSPRHDLASLPDLTPGCSVRINEVATGTTTSALEEFVELYNPCDGPVSLAQHKLVYRAAGGTSDVNLVADLQVTVQKGGFAVFAGGTYYSSLRQGMMAAGLAEAGGGLAVRDPAGAIVDSMGWGSATNAFVVASPAPAPLDKAEPGRSVVRNPDGHVTVSSAADFLITTMPTPGAANVVQ